MRASSTANRHASGGVSADLDWSLPGLQTAPEGSAGPALLPLSFEPQESNAAAFAEKFRACAAALSNYLEIDAAEGFSQIAVLGPDPNEALSRSLASGLYDEDDLAEIRRNILGGESYFIHGLSLVYLSTDRLAVVAEEVTHVLRHLCTGTPAALSRSDLFYQTVLNEMLGYVGSKLIEPARLTPSEAEILSVIERPLSFGFAANQRRAFTLAATHLQAEMAPAGGAALRKIYKARAGALVGAAHLLGYALGERFYFALRSGVVTRADLFTLFHEDWNEPGRALCRYLVLRGELGDMPLPQPHRA